uniref:Uncharacterized protein n=1 Tax=Arundo donax TaxID=35708 RepID=A0A0A9DAI7_ARUDO
MDFIGSLSCELRSFVMRVEIADEQHISCIEYDVRALAIIIRHALWSACARRCTNAAASRDSPAGDIAPKAKSSAPIPGTEQHSSCRAHPAAGARC